METIRYFSIFFLLFVWVFWTFHWKVDAITTVSYDGRALLINGQRRVLISGSIHYPRSTPEVCNLLGFVFIIIYLLLLNVC